MLLDSVAVDAVAVDLAAMSVEANKRFAMYSAEDHHLRWNYMSIVVGFVSPPLAK